MRDDENGNKISFRNMLENTQHSLRNYLLLSCRTFSSEKRFRTQNRANKFQFPESHSCHCHNISR